MNACKHTSFFLFVCVMLVVASCTAISPSPQALTQITLQLRWTHNAQSAGYYAADQNGYYAAAGLAVTFLEGGPRIDGLGSVLNGTAQFGVINSDRLVGARADGKPVRAIAAVYRHSPSVFMALADSGIKTPQDFVGKTIETAPTGHGVLNAMMARLGIQPGQYTTADSTPDLKRFYAGEVQVRSVFLTNEVLTAQAAGYKLNIIYPDDYGIHLYADTIFASDDWIAANPELVKRFLGATLKGWTYAVENPTTAGSLVSRHQPKADAAHENAFMAASIPLINTGEDHIGWMKAEDWVGMEKTLREAGVLTKPVSIDQVYTLQFIQSIYP